jgi:hypothetical protein
MSVRYGVQVVAEVVVGTLGSAVPTVPLMLPNSGWEMKCGSGGGGVTKWAEVAPAGLVGSEVLGQQLWQVVNEAAGRA